MVIPNVIKTSCHKNLQTFVVDKKIKLHGSVSVATMFLSIAGVQLLLTG
jgi:hypothetical protein